ncbi:regulatory alcR, partial [Fusarium phyllophilum]
MGIFAMRSRQFHLMQRHPLLGRKSVSSSHACYPPGIDHVALLDGGSEPGLKSCSYCIRTKKVCSLNPQWGKTRSRSRVSETGSSITSTSNDSSKRKRNESPATTTAPSLNVKYCEITAANMLQMIQDSSPGQGLSWNNPFTNTDIPSFLSMDPTLDAQSLAMSFSSPESASQTVAPEAIDEALPELTKQTSHAATDALDNSTSYSGSQDFDINNLWDLDFSDINSAPLDTLSSTESPANRYNAVQVKRRARLPSNDWSGYPNFSPSPFTGDSLIMQTSNRYMITESLLQIYHDVLENNLACWLAEENCPYKLQVVARASPAPEPNLGATPGPSRQNPNLPPEWGAAWSNRMYRRVVELDRAAQSARLINLTRSESQAVSRVLDLVIMAFTTQWAQGNRRQERFSMGANDFATEADDLADALNQEFEETLQQSVWEQAKRALQDVVDVESYRAIYAELIFGLTQKPWASDDYQQKSFGSKKEKSGGGIKKNAMPEIIEIMSQEGPHIYLERATRKIHALKFRFEASESGFMETSKKHAPRRLTEENRRTIGLLYWLAVMFDTVSSSMNERPVALADEDCQHEDADQILADSMRAAQKSRRGSQRWEMELFIQDDAAKPTVGTRWPCSYDDAMQMVAKSAPVKILIYRHLSYLQNTLRKRECPQAIEEIIQQTTLLYRYWNMTHGAFFRDLIRHYDTIPPRIRSWFFCIAVPWHLGALMLADVLEFIDKNNYGLDQARQKRLSGNVAARIRKASAIELADLAQVTTPRLFQEAGINTAQLPDYHFAQEIRIAELAPGQASSPILHITLKHVSLLESPKYWTLSYTWGSPFDGLEAEWDDPTAERMIRADGEKFYVRWNLEAALRCLASYDVPSIWIDAICIDQDNVAEKTQQVQMMGQIYKSSVATLAWLGPSSDDSSRATGAISRFSQSWQNRPDHLRRVTLTSSDLEEYRSCAQDDLGYDSAVEDLRAISHLLERSWFHRVWIVQEVSLSKEVYLLWGNGGVSYWGWLESALLLLFQHCYSIAMIKDPHFNVRYLLEKLMHLQGSATWVRRTNDLRRLAQSNVYLSPIAVLEALSTFGASDKRDHVYAGLSMSPDLGTIIEADYSVPEVAVFRNATRKVIEKSNDFSILAFWRPSAIDRLPSWAIDFNKSGGVALGSFRILNSKDQLYCAGGDLRPEVRFENDSSMLMHGVPLGVLCFVGSTAPRQVILGENENNIAKALAGELSINLKALQEAWLGGCLCQDLFPDTGEYIWTGEDYLNAFARTICCDFTSYNNSTPHRLGPTFTFTADSWAMLLRSDMLSILQNRVFA